MSIELFSLGEIYISDFLAPGEEPSHPPVELKLMLDDDGIVHLDKMAPKETMWGSRYWYSSSVSDLMKKQLKDVVDSTLEVLPHNHNLVWVDIAGNSGYMLSQVPKHFITINIDPVCQNEIFYKEASGNCDIIIADYFSKEVYNKKPLPKASVVSCVSMFYDLMEPAQFLNDVHEVMEEDAIFVLQLSYSPLMLEQLEFSNICHEHAKFYSFFNLKSLLEKHNFRVMDVSLNNTNAGSFRVYAMKKDANIKKFGSTTHRDVCNFRIASLLGYEKTLGLDTPEPWINFYNKVLELKKKTISFLQEQKALGKTVIAYGASTKFNTVLQMFGIDSTLISAIAERSPAKYGRRTIGSNIPIISEEQMREIQPDFLVIGPFQFLAEFMEREAEYISRGGCLVTLMPSFEVIGKNN
jgi:hypothetical protein